MQVSPQTIELIRLIKERLRLQAKITFLMDIYSEKLKSADVEDKANRSRIALIDKINELLAIKHNTPEFNEPHRNILDEIRYINYCNELQNILRIAYKTKFFGECVIRKVEWTLDIPAMVALEDYPYKCGDYNDVNQKRYFEILLNSAEARIQNNKKALHGLDVEIRILEDQLEQVTLQSALTQNKNKPIIFSKPIVVEMVALPPIKKQSNISKPTIK